jgi:dienelactone hydrolase
MKSLLWVLVLAFSMMSAWPCLGNGNAWLQPPRSLVDPESGAGYRLERVYVQSGKDRIAATFIRPDDDARVPVMITVSGAQDGLLAAEGPLQRRLVRRGMGVLSLGKKGVGASSGHWKKESFHDRADNVRAAMDWVSSRDDVDASRIVLYGHSQGGYVIPLVAGDPRIAAMILAAGPAETVREQIQSYEFEQKRRGGLGEAEARGKARALTRRLDLLSKGCGLGAFHYLCRIYHFDPAAPLAAIPVPVLALFAEKDPMVPPGANLERMRTALSSNPEAHLRVIPEANHDFIKSVTGLMTEVHSLIGPPAQFAHARSGDPDHERLRKAWHNRVEYGDGFFEAIETFLDRYVPAATH